MRYGSYRAAGTRLGSTFNRTEVELRDEPNPATNPQASTTISAAVDSRSASGGEVSPDVSPFFGHRCGGEFVDGPMVKRCFRPKGHEGEHHPYWSEW